MMSCWHKGQCIMDDVMLTDEVVMDYHSCALVLKSSYM